MTTEHHNSQTQPKAPVVQWFQITTSVLTLLASLGLWLFKTASTPSAETTEIRSQLTEVTKEMVKLQLDLEGYKYRIESLEATRTREESKK